MQQSYKTNFAIINADDIARNIVEPDSVCLKEIADCFGVQIINQDRSLNRKKLAAIVFNEPQPCVAA